MAEVAKLATHLPKVMADAENALAHLSNQAARGVDLSAQSLEALAQARRSSIGTCSSGSPRSCSRDLDVQAVGLSIRVLLHFEQFDLEQQRRVRRR